MGNFLRISNGVPRSFAEAGAALPTIYDDYLLVVASSPGANEILAVTAGTSITIPGSETYTSDELEVEMNGASLESAYDYNYVSTPPRTQISLTFDLEVGDRLHFKKLRNF